ncbi:MAG TPA: glycoside hydrolase family 15 protein [Gemmatirosa sp.]
MTPRIEDYALIGDCETAALVSRDGSVDWLCLPRFDSAACFASLVGTPENGRWLLAPADPAARATRRYRPDTMVLETEWETADGAVTVIDFMPVRDEKPDLVRIVVGRRGQVAMRTEFVVRFAYGVAVPWVSRLVDDRDADRDATQVGQPAPATALRAIAGPDMVILRTPVTLRGEDLKTVGDFTVAAGETVPFTLSYAASHAPPPEANDPLTALAKTEAFWREWAGRCTYRGEHRDPVVRSLLTLKALTYAPTGGIVAAPTTSLPEQIGGPRNWDYRYCWLRDATLTLSALMNAGYEDEAAAWRDWLLRAVAGSPSQVQIMYGIRGERHLLEWEVPWLSGYEASAPVRVGNAAHDQLQLDVFGEVIDALAMARTSGSAESGESWSLARALATHLETIWAEPDEGLWEVRGSRQHFTHSKVMAWVAFDRMVRAVERYGLEGPVDRWRAVRTRIHDEVCARAFDPALGSFVQAYDSKQLDASTLMIPLVGFLPPHDPRVGGTVAAIEARLLDAHGFVRRYETGKTDDGLPGGEGAFLACSFWLAENYVLLGRPDEARALYGRLLGLCNDVGLLSEEYDADAGRLVGNFPQAFSHLGLVGTAFALAGAAPGLGLDGEGTVGGSVAPGAMDAAAVGATPVRAAAVRSGGGDANAADGPQ